MQQHNKPDINTQINFIKDAIAILSTDEKATIVLDKSTSEMLREIAQNLIANRLIEKFKELNGHEHKGPYLKWTIIKTNDVFMSAMRDLDCIVETVSFREYKHKDKQIYLRVPFPLQGDCHYKMYIEPQVNMSKSLRYGSTCIKIQLTLMELNRGSRFSTPIESRMPKADFVDYLRLSEEWNDKLDEMIMDQPEFYFDPHEGEPEPTVDRRDNVIQYDLK